MLDSIRYYLAWLTLATLPFAVLYWYAVHPFARFWRRFGGWGVGAVAVLMLLVNVAVVAFFREPLLAVSFAVAPLQRAVSGVLYLTAAVIDRVCRRHLTFRILVGAPEVNAHDGGQLLQSGIYGRIRHPRYVAVSLGMLAAALFCNYYSLWIVTILMFPALYGIVLLEERELRERFGDDYRDYAARVPRFVPRFS
ncbi:MAG: hypothetical protein GKS06_05545 [Acidobacteria bacterium]|nr:hypothetical protein [Acidobacteriota bacterium]